VPGGTTFIEREAISMAGDDTVTIWLDGAKAGDDRAIQKLWDRYFHRLVRLAAKRLPGHARRDVDEEDVALSVFHSFCDRIGRGEFSQISGRDDLWRLLSVITARKASNVVRTRACLKRGGGMVLGESALVEGHDDGDPGLAQFLDREPSPELAAQLADDFRHVMESLGSPALRTIALMRLEGHTTEEIGRRMAISSRSVERKLRLIRMIWGRAAFGQT
jgi:DNA-directed RNA polymerase specialized sigma24 family protein